MQIHHPCRNFCGDCPDRKKLNNRISVKNRFTLDALDIMRMTNWAQWSIKSPLVNRNYYYLCDRLRVIINARVLYDIHHGQNLAGFLRMEVDRLFHYLTINWLPRFTNTGNTLRLTISSAYFSHEMILRLRWREYFSSRWLNDWIIGLIDRSCTLLHFQSY